MKINNVIAIIGMLAMLTLSTIAQTAVTTTTTTAPVTSPDKLPIGSVAEMEAYAWEQVTFIDMYGWASSSINATTNTKTSEWMFYQGTNGIVDIDEIFGMIMSKQLALSVLYPSDTIQFSVHLYDRDYQNLFHGYSFSGITPPRDGVSRNVIDVSLDINQSISVDFPGANWFYIVERDDNGNPVRFYYPKEYEVGNGKIQVPLYFCGKDGELVVTTDDGLQVAYGLKGGKRITPTTVKLSAISVTAVGTRTIRNSSTAYVEVSYKEYLMGINPLVQFVQNGTNLVSFAAWQVGDPNQKGGGPILGYASAVQIWAKGHTASSGQIYRTQDTPIMLVKLPLGQYWARYIFSGDFGQHDQRFYSPNQGGGGGMGAPIEEDVVVAPRAPEVSTP